MAQGPDTVGYRRVSSEEQAALARTSLQDQTHAIQRLAAQLGRTLPDELVWEDRCSGADAQSRTGFMELVAFCRAHPRHRSSPGYVLALNDSRFGRFEDPDEAPFWRFELARAGWRVRFAENDATEHVTARHVLRSIGTAQATKYLQNLKENTTRGTRGAAALGLWQNEAPFGYRRLATAPGREPVVLEAGQRKGGDQQVRLTPGPPEEVEVVKWAFSTYAAGEINFAQLRQELRRRAPRLGWNRHYIGWFLSNRVYLGEVVWCRRPHDKRERAETPRRAESEWVVTPNAHPALVTREVFDAVQERRAEKRRRPPGSRVPGTYALTGLVRCAVCGYAYNSGGSSTGRRGGELHRYRFYRCAGSLESKDTCPGKIGTVSREILEGLVVSMVAEVVSAPQVQALIREEAERLVREQRGGTSEERAALEGERRRLEHERDALVRGLATGAVSLEASAERMRAVRAGLAHVEDRLRNADASAALAETLEREGERLVSLAEDFAARAQELTGPALRELLEPWITEALYDKESRALTLWIRQVPVLASQPRSPGAIREEGTVMRRVVVPALERDPRTGRLWRPLHGSA